MNKLTNADENKLLGGDNTTDTGIVSQHWLSAYLIS